MTRAGAAELLGPDGPFARAMPAYEVRHGQLEMAEAVERALSKDRVLLSEAGTGTGKTLAYLVPALMSGRKVVVSTATRALQEQIFFKDLPLIERALGVKVEAALMKGLSNYVCRRRLEDHRSTVEARGPSALRVLASVERWVAETESGDISEIGTLGEDDPTLAAITSSSDTRIGASCRFHAECFVTRMKRAADSARLVVVNHHLFFADLSLRGAHPGRVLPDYDAVVFDEAHQIEDVATTFFGVRVSEARVSRLVRDVEGMLTSLARSGSPAGGSVVAGVREAARAFFARVAADARASEGRATLEHDFWTGERRTLFHALDDALDGLRALSASLGGSLGGGGSAPTRGREALALADGFEVAARRTDELRDDLATIVDGSSGRVTWLDTSSRSASLSSSPVDLSSVLRTRLFETIPSVVLTSATLSSGPDGEPGPSAFEFVRKRLGITGDAVSVSEIVVPSPFDYAAHAVLYLPRDLPDPRDPSFLSRATERIAALVEITGGGAFVLTTSLRSMRELHRGLAGRLAGRRIMVQGEAPKSAVLSAFRAEGDAVLVATASFWQGVDVPGDALRLVVLEKIPFPVPTDPIMSARSKALEGEGGRPFVDLHLPLAKIALKQGFGRLIRTHRDRGIVALLDERVHRRGYGKELLAALPPAKRTHDLEEVRALWREISAERDAADLQ